ncbi:FecCD family ABC transporter permease [Melghirimyces algeriensis]|uniref:Iron complex transport system permease protein n=1 Tax=Melghirimyces algeriensis TaxID=910412 RepID=A0A521ABZ2_9BACL|nr:iron ABC transporter permease [Melghirimyces algeriensis]SMO32230.1 iron complex transport system permease protein [Melghirimyces algeriensis]
MDKYVTLRSKTGSFSFQVEKRAALILGGLFLCSLLLFVICTSLGSSYIPPLAVVQQFLGIGEKEYEFILHVLRLPRVTMAYFVGAALGVSGLILQRVIRNPLGSPDIVGVTGGASGGAIVFIVFFMGSVSLRWLPLAAILGAAIATLFIYSLSWKKGVTPIRLILIGIGISALMNAFVTMMIVISETAVTTKAYLWLTGSFYGTNWEDVSLMVPWIVILIPLALLLTGIVNVKELGDDVALGLGVRVQWYRFILIAISVGLAGVAVAFAGGIGFVGLIAPHVARMLLGRSFARLVLGSAMIGGLIVILADTIARTAFLPLDIPAGVFTAGIGAPFFIYLLYRNQQRLKG